MTHPPAAEQQGTVFLFQPLKPPPKDGSSATLIHRTGGEETARIRCWRRYNEFTVRRFLFFPSVCKKKKKKTHIHPQHQEWFHWQQPFLCLPGSWLLYVCVFMCVRVWESVYIIPIISILCSVFSPVHYSKGVEKVACVCYIRTHSQCDEIIRPDSPPTPPPPFLTNKRHTESRGYRAHAHIFSFT